MTSNLTTPPPLESFGLEYGFRVNKRLNLSFVPTADRQGPSRSLPLASQGSVGSRGLQTAPMTAEEKEEVRSPS